MKIWIAAALACLMGVGAWAQQETPQRVNNNVFRQLGQELPTPNVYRTASGAPGHAYWQQKAGGVLHEGGEFHLPLRYGTILIHW